MSETFSCPKCRGRNSTHGLHINPNTELPTCSVCGQDLSLDEIREAVAADDGVLVAPTSRR